MNKITRRQLQDIIEQVITDMNPGLTDDLLVEAIESGDKDFEAVDLIIDTLRDEFYPEQKEIPMFKGTKESLDNLTIRNRDA